MREKRDETEILISQFLNRLIFKFFTLSINLPLIGK
jgi:hypothetical protein